MEQEKIKEKLEEVKKVKGDKLPNKDNDKQKTQKLKSILKSTKYYYNEEPHFHHSILQAASWKFNVDVFNELYNHVYEEYAIRLYSEKDIKECLINALSLSTYLTLLKDPEKEIMYLFNFVRDSVFMRHARETAFKGKKEGELLPFKAIAAESAPTAFFMDGIFSAMYIILENQPYKSLNLKIALRMIDTHLYNYVNSLAEKHKKTTSQWGMLYNPKVAEKTLLEALKEKEEKAKVCVPLEVDAYRSYIGVGDENLKEYTNNFNLEDVRIITSLIPSEEEQEEFLTDVISAVRNSIRELLNIKKVTFNIWEPLHNYLHQYGMKSEEELLPIDADNYAACVDKIVNSIGIPTSWAKMTPDGDGGNFVKLCHKLSIIYYGTTEEEKLKNLLYNLNYTPPKWFSLRDNPEAINYQLYLDVCKEIHKLKQWNYGLESQDICDIIAMGLNIRENITDEGKLAPFFKKRLRINTEDKAFKITTLNLMGWLSSTDVGALLMTVAEIQQNIIGNTADGNHRSAIKKGRGEETTGMNKDVAAAFGDLMPYLYDKLNYIQLLANYTH